jgi:5-deoxy-glucuronate isomerase
MLEKPEFNGNNERILCEMNGKNAEMKMNIKVKRLLKGESFELTDAKNETAYLILKGNLDISFAGKTENMKRKNPFEMTPYCLHVCKNTKVKIIANENSEFIIQQTDNEKEFPPVFYKPEDCLYQHFGKDQWEGTGYRICSTMFDYDNAPYSNMVMGEVFNQPGRWSSYPPHHHPQPEVYYYQFNPQQGFGACFLGDDVYKSTDGSYCTITDGHDHEQVVAPGYTMYYVWMIRHIDGDPWYKTTRFYSDEHKWLVDAD